MDIEKEMNPGAYELKQDEDGVITSVIVDEELDGFPCVFDGDNSLEIDVRDYEWITLSTRTLHRMIDLIERAQDMENEG